MNKKIILLDLKGKNLSITLTAPTKYIKSCIFNAQIDFKIYELDAYTFL